jgi:ATP-dependent Clp protease, protease subunit
MNGFTNRIPTVVEGEGLRERVYDLYSLLFRERIVFLGSGIDDQVANLVVAQLLFLEREDPEKEIQMFIHSPGGQAYAGMAIYDTMQQLTAPIRTIAVGLTASFGTILLAAGTPGRRYALANATVHMHQPLGGAQGQATDLQIQAEEVLRLRRRVEEILAYHTGQSEERIRRDIERDIYLQPDQALDYGLIDGILPNRPPGTKESSR